MSVLGTTRKARQSPVFTAFGTEADYAVPTASMIPKLKILQFLRSLYDRLSDPEDSDKYYDILIEFVKLPRSIWRTVKERVRLCVEKVGKDEFAQPYRIVPPQTGCGFVFIPVQSELVLRPDWPVIRDRAIRQFTAAHKYDQRLSKCIGVLFAKQGSSFYIDWYLEAYEWVEDPDFQRALDENFPFRRVKEVKLHGYFFE